MLLGEGRMTDRLIDRWGVICIYDPDLAVKRLYKGFMTYCLVRALAVHTGSMDPPSLKYLAEKVGEMGRILKESDPTAYERFRTMVKETDRIWPKKRM